MTIYFQHVGEANSNRDFPRTLFSRGELHQFKFEDVAPYLEHLPEAELQRLSRLCVKDAPDGFQIWGIPSGAKTILKNFIEGDQLLLVKSITFGGAIEYSGRVIAIPRGECFDLSQHLWAEARFPLICFLVGEQVRFPWPVFLEAFDFKSNWNPAGRIWRLLPTRVRASRYGSEEEVIRAISEYLSPDYL